MQWPEMKHLLKKFYLGNSQDDTGISDEKPADDRCDSEASVTASATEFKPFTALSGWLTKHNQLFSGTSQSSQDGGAEQSTGTLEGHGEVVDTARVMGGADEAESLSEALNSSVDKEGEAQAVIQSLDEEYQVQLAMALSVCHSENMDPEAAEIEAAKKISLGISASDQQAEVIAFQYWVDNVVNYDDKVADGFYDIYGIACDPYVSEKIPALVDLQGRPATDLISCEVVLVNRGTDEELVILERRAMELATECRVGEVSSVKNGLAQKIGKLVADKLGGPVESDVDILTLWRKSSEELRSALGSNIIPLGFLRFGLARHRALLFKVLSDCVGIPCRLVKGKHYTGAEEGAFNFIKDNGESEYIVDLMGAPGAIIPPDVPRVPLISEDISGKASSTDKGVHDMHSMLAPTPSQAPLLSSEGFRATRDQKYDEVNERVLESTIGADGAKVKVLVTELHLGGRHHSEPTELDGLSAVPSRPTAARFGHSHSHLRSPSWTEGIGSHAAREMKAKDVSMYMLDAAKENPELAQKLHNVLRESGVVAPPELFSEISPKQLQAQAKEDRKASENKPGKEKRKPDEVPKGRSKGKPPPGVTKHSSPAGEAAQDRLPRLQSVEGLGERRPLEPLSAASPAITTSLVTSSATVSVLAAVQESLPPELMKRVPVAAASAITAAVVASSMVVAAVKSEIGQDPNLEGPITAAATATAAIVAATSAAAGLRIESGENSPSSYPDNEGSGKNLGGEPARCEEAEAICKASSSGSSNPAGSREGEVVSGEDQNSDRPAERMRIHTELLLDDVAEFEIPWEEIVIGDRIGLGSYGEVYRGEWHGTEVAVKKFLDQDITGDALEEFRSEIVEMEKGALPLTMVAGTVNDSRAKKLLEVRLMRRMRHPNVVLFMGAVTRAPNLSIVTEFLSRGSLYRLLHRSNSLLDERRRLRMALDVAKGMNYLHTCTPMIVHRDLKSPNLLVDKNWVVKVCDFGLSRMKHHTFLSSKSTAGTPEWMAPEVLRNEPSNEKADVYSFGVILWELATLQQPWNELNPMQVVGAVGFQNRRLDIPDMDPNVAKIIQDCFLNEPQLRPSFAQIMSALKPLQRPISASQLHTSKPNLVTVAASQPKPHPVQAHPLYQEDINQTADACNGNDVGEGLHEKD
ncbi:hypothetical protein O6H91_14G042000 [Diphasiastrum complanatum]|uniref:Uncharacterized protein n=1 Tax=Diphasiastrum complanatum TaxID=34168 RepID=A0ACC2BNV7_DIPCM|nr:hypothetical protein O6H91_14G042000 [Diphasiastrum complanatum]